MRKRTDEVKNIVAEFDACGSFAPSFGNNSILRYTGGHMSSVEAIDSYEGAFCVDRYGDSHDDMITDDGVEDRTRISMKINGGEVELSPYVLTILATTDAGQKLKLDEDVVVF